MSNFRDLLRKTKTEIDEISPEDLKDRLQGGPWPRLLDIREQDEVQNGMIPGAAHLSRAHFESRVEDVLPDKDADIVVYCAGAVRSVFAVKTLQELGYTKVASMTGGFTRWRELGYDFAVPKILTGGTTRPLLATPDPSRGGRGRPAEVPRGRVLSIGAGGLGSPALLYLAAAGVGTIGIVDCDVVEESNLQRQVIHNTENIGVLKAESAKETINKLNPDVDVVVHPYRIDASNARDLIARYDVIVDGCDNFDTRYVVNDVAVELRKPVIHGSIFRFEGMASTFVPFEGPCYRCLYPEAPPPELAPT